MIIMDRGRHCERSEAIHGYKERLDCFVAALLAMTEKGIYRLVSRQPAASASSTEQNQRVPLLICIWIFAYQRLGGVFYIVYLLCVCVSVVSLCGVGGGGAGVL